MNGKTTARKTARRKHKNSLVLSHSTPYGCGFESLTSQPRTLGPLFLSKKTGNRLTLKRLTRPWFLRGGHHGNGICIQMRGVFMCYHM